VTRAPVTIAIPTRNRRVLLGAAVDSALAATQPHDQIVVSDNASTDDTMSYLVSLADPRITVLRQNADLGMVGNWNACLAAARGDRFVLLSDDDLISPTALDALAAPLVDESVAVSYGRARTIDQKGAERTLGHLGPPRENLESFLGSWFQYSRTIYPCATMMRTPELRAVNGYNPKFGPFADVGAWLGVWRNDAKRFAAFSEQVVASYRSHEAALSTGDMDGSIGGLRALQSAFCDVIPFAERGFEAMAAHYVASALRRRAGSAAIPVLAYGALLLQHLPLVIHNWTFDAYWRQVIILTNPERYERAKQERAGK
jgi:glycosyltransferase involved in cell wall biosynthesis